MVPNHVQQVKQTVHNDIASLATCRATVLAWSSGLAKALVEIYNYLTPINVYVLKMLSVMQGNSAGGQTWLSERQKLPIIHRSHIDSKLISINCSTPEFE